MTITWVKETKTGSGGDYYYVNNIVITSEDPDLDAPEEYAFPTSYTDQQIEDYIITDLTNKGY